MNELQVQFLDNVPGSITGIAGMLDGLKKNKLSFAPWSQFPYKPSVHFSIAYDARNIYLKFDVKEEAIRAQAMSINGPVWEDSCVEFFISFGETGYYNIEVNCIGTLLCSFGEGRQDRTMLDEDIIRRITSRSVIMQAPGMGYVWELTLVIPFEIFDRHTFQTLRGKQAKGNFYKCGDCLPVPHFLSWAPIDNPTPNFHLPQYFGSLWFQ